MIGGEQPVDLGFGGRAPFVDQRPLDHAARAAADQPAGRLERHGGEPLPREDHIERVDEVGRGIDQRAVEIEDDGEHGASPNRRAAAAQGSRIKALGSGAERG